MFLVEQCLFMPAEEGMASSYVEISLRLKAKESHTQANLRKPKDGDGFDSKRSPGPTAWMQATSWLLTIQSPEVRLLGCCLAAALKLNPFPTFV